MSDDPVYEAIPTALQLVGAVRCYDIHRAHDLLRKADLPALAVALAAMVPEDKTRTELLGWLRPPTTTRPARRLAPCGTHAAFNRHKERGERIDGPCLEAEREYQRLRKRKERAA